ncbi:hypothetical protein EX30DRAFT_346358 [Ascodesmis nigricans]|uniref:Uncharacterized protein n=1 Tax=Ascodesmis nigricans TaxID=341454 RepID=A0A4S2N324_9PEZI|nr:hypothetical protein EX30DRAFT_346358 [Ascodesmis nigricans]
MTEFDTDSRRGEIYNERNFTSSRSYDGGDYGLNGLNGLNHLSNLSPSLQPNFSRHHHVLRRASEKENKLNVKKWKRMGPCAAFIADTGFLEKEGIEYFTTEEIVDTVHDDDWPSDIDYVKATSSVRTFMVTTLKGQVGLGTGTPASGLILKFTSMRIQPVTILSSIKLTMIGSFIRTDWFSSSAPIFKAGKMIKHLDLTRTEFAVPSIGTILARATCLMPTTGKMTSLLAMKMT